ncbi:Retrovirus-related Pol polyprotein from transposon 17.6 [Senna tora]|uniref:Retrovirus-related Pol polyprotein from transposon 17.6 n=1 Tax=Senna tora TaxID=362788 RepID=A0A835CER4_9FABA|nr:Retrovirus-related Pol polyprotein from transposon 17.6 [Senna tora]
MVNTRMEGRVDNVENEMASMKVEMATMKVDITGIKELMQVMTATLARIEGKNGPEPEPEGSHSVGNRERNREEQQEEGGGENRERRRRIPEDEIGGDREYGKYRRLELPIFNGEDPIGWLFRVERYFIVNAVPGEEKLDAVAVCMEGKALNWLQWLEVRKPVQSWSEFKTELLRRFHESQQGNGYEILMAHKQSGTVGDYRERFELLSAPLKDATEEMLIGFYQNGLKEEVRAELRMTQAQNLLDVMDMSQKIEERNEVVERLREEKIKQALKPIQLPKWNNGPLKPNFTKVSNPSHLNISSASTPTKASEVKEGTEKKSSVPSTSTSKKNYRRLTDEEVKRKRELGECWTYEEAEEELSVEIEEMKEDKTGGTLMSLSINSVVGITGGRTMKLKGKIRGSEVLIMIDSGATHNFISEGLVKKMGLDVEKTKPYRVTLGDGYTVQQQGCCKGLEIEMQGLRAEQGVVCLEGDPALAKSLVSMKNLMRSVRKGGQGFLLELNEIAVQAETEPAIDERIQKVIDDHAEVGRTIEGLPPHRSRDHAIIIREGEQPPNIRPYRYPHSQKAEIEKLKDAFKWGERAQAAFEELKKPMTTVPVLAMPDFSQPFELETDASGTGIGAVLMQNKRPIAYYSHVLSNRARHSSVYERELMAIVFAVKKWRHYLLGHRFVIKTDQKALKFLLEQRIMDPDQQKWMSKLMGYKFEIQYKPGAENRAVDALSRRGTDLELKAFSVWQYEDLEDWDTEVQQDDKLTQIKQQIITGTAAPPGILSFAFKHERISSS